MTGVFMIIVSLVATISLLAAAKIDAGQPILTWMTAAQTAGLTGIIGLCWSYLLAARHPILETIFGGLDKAYKIHHIVGGIAFILVINHPLFLILSALPANTVSTYLLPSQSIPYTLGVAALYTLGLLLILTLFVDLPYRLWKKTHEWMGMVIILGSLHAYLVPSSVASFPPLKIWILTWSAIATLGFVYKRYWYYLAGKHFEYRVQKVETEGELAIVRLEYAGKGEPLKIEPGQYAFFSLPGDQRDEHPFSVLSQIGEQLVIGFNITGPFTLKLARIQNGMNLKIRGPYGTFGQITGKAKEMVWIAGGIGITPFASMAAAIKPDQKVTMFYTTRSGGPETIAQAFRRHSQIMPNFRWIEHLSEKAGHLTGEVLMRATEISRDTYFLLCGPQAMMESITAQLTQMGVKRKRIIYEDFSMK